MICDIVDFSRLPHELQAEAVRRLWSYLRINPSQALLSNPERYVINGTGDGLMLAYISDTEAKRHAEFIEFAAGIVQHMHAGDGQFHVRVGVHQGQFGFIEVPGARTRQAVGTGINQCARIVAVGDRDTVTVGENFLIKWSARSRDDVRQDFVPGPGKPAHAVIIKRGEVFNLRFYSPPHRTLPHASKKIESFKVVRTLIDRQLAAMDGALKDLLHTAQSALKDVPLDVRISVLTERTPEHGGERALCTTDYRHHANGYAIRASNTVYPLANGGTSPAAHAYAANTVCVAHQLPEWLIAVPATQDAYYTAFTADRPYRALGRDIVDGFGRHARTYLAFPFSLVPADPAQDINPDGVICIDLMQPLDGFEAEQLRQFTEALREKFSEPLAQLWRLRGQL